MSDVTGILFQIEHGDPHAAEKLLPLVYEELRRLAGAKLAGDRPGQTLQATALVHEAYLRLVDNEKAQQWNCRGHNWRTRRLLRTRISLTWMTPWTDSPQSSRNVRNWLSCVALPGSHSTRPPQHSESAAAA